MPLSEDEQRILQQIEQQFYEQDPDLAGEIGRRRAPDHPLRRMKLAGALFVVSLVGLLAALYFEQSIVVAFVGFLTMLGSAVWFYTSVESMGGAGMQRLTTSLRERGFGDGVRGATDRVRERLRRDEE